MLDIYVRTAQGAAFRAFTWTRDEESGKRRAFTDGLHHGFEVEEAFAVPAGSPPPIDLVDPEWDD